MKTFSKKEIIEDIIEYLENTGGVYGCDLHSEVFNTDYYIIGTYKAKEALESYGVFNAINKVQTYSTIFPDLIDCLLLHQNSMFHKFVPCL